MDFYSKVIFTVIAVALLAIAVKLWEPKTAYSAGEQRVRITNVTPIDVNIKRSR